MAPEGASRCRAVASGLLGRSAVLVSALGESARNLWMGGGKVKDRAGSVSSETAIGFVSPKCSTNPRPGRRPRSGEPGPMITGPWSWVPAFARTTGHKGPRVPRATFTMSNSHPPSLKLRRASDQVRHSLGDGGPPRSRGAFLRPGFAPWLRAHRIEGWAERRQAPFCYRCRAGKRECGPRG
jgi:hypothetical protein